MRDASALHDAGSRPEGWAGFPRSEAERYDCVIVGGGPAGLSAALMLGRCRRRVLLCDTGEGRNRRAHAMHGFLTRDGTAPAELLRVSREQLRPYDTVELSDRRIVDATRGDGGFDLAAADGSRLRARRLLLATGVVDELPAVPGLPELYGRSVHHCPYCDGWEHRDQNVAVIGRGTSAAGLALSLKTWTPHVVLYTNGAPMLRSDDRRRLTETGIPIRSARITGVNRNGNRVRAVALEDESAAPCDAVFFSGRQTQQCELAARLGCAMNRRGVVKTDHLGRTHIPGLYVVGDASRDVQFAIVAAAEGAKAGVAINKALQQRAGLAVAPKDEEEDVRPSRSDTKHY